MENIKVGTLLRVKTFDEYFEHQEKATKNATLGSITVKQFMDLIRKNMEITNGIQVIPIVQNNRIRSDEKQIKKQYVDVIPFGFKGLLLTGTKKDIDGLFYKVLYKEKEVWVPERDVEVCNEKE